MKCKSVKASLIHIFTKVSTFLWKTLYFLHTCSQKEKLFHKNVNNFLCLTILTDLATKYLTKGEF
jgi:hypothetical protein